jgi:hypothetical protein
MTRLGPPVATAPAKQVSSTARFCAFPWVYLPRTQNCCPVVSTALLYCSRNHPEKPWRGYESTGTYVRGSCRQENDWCCTGTNTPRKSKSAVLVVSPDNNTPVPASAPAWQPTSWRAEDITVHTLLGVGGQASVYLAEKDGSQFAFKYAVVSLPQMLSGGVGPAFHASVPALLV